MSQKRNKDFEKTNSKYLKNENISLVTGKQVRQFYADEDRDSSKVRRFEIFQKNPAPQHHYRYILEQAPSKQISKEDSFFNLHLKSKNKKLISYCLIYILMFTCAMTLLYLFYTPKKINLFGFNTNNRFPLKFYRFVVSGNASTTITPKIITITESTILIDFRSTKPNHVEMKPKSTSILQKTLINKISNTSVVSNQNDTMSKIRISPKKASSNSSDKSVEKMFTFTLENSKKSFDQEKTNKKLDTGEIKFLTTCFTINVTESNDSFNKKIPENFSTNLVQPTMSSVFSTDQKSNNSWLTTRSKIIEVFKEDKAVASKILPKDIFTETHEFHEKFSYSNTQASNIDKNETIYDEAIVDNGILLTEDEEEERKKDEIESKLKIASFFNIDPITGKEKNDEKINFLSTKLSKPLRRANQTNKYVSPNHKNENQLKSSLMNGYQQFNHNRDFTPTKLPVDNKLKYHPMFKLLYGSCYEGCND